MNTINIKALSEQVSKLSSSIGSDLPEVDVSDVGKVLTVGDTGEWEADELPPQLPEVDESDAGKVLTVGDTGEWEADEIASGGYAIPSGVLTATGNTIAGYPEKIYIGDAPTEQLALGFHNIIEIHAMEIDGSYRHVRKDLSADYGLSSADNGNLVQINDPGTLEAGSFYVRGY